MRLNEESARARFDGARVARLATVSATGMPHLVPVTFTIRGDVVVMAIDAKPKTTMNPKRVRNIRETGRVSLLADEYDDDWSRLWWARVDGRARVVEKWHDREEPIAWLRQKYPQYSESAPAGPVIWVDIELVIGWAFAEGPF